MRSMWVKDRVKSSNKKVITKPSIKPTINPSILEGIPKTIVNFNIFSIMPLTFINTFSTASKTMITKIKEII